MNNVQSAKASVTDTQPDNGIAPRRFSRYRQQRVLDVPIETLRTIEESESARNQRDTETYDKSPGPLPLKAEETSASLADREKKRYQRTMVSVLLDELNLALIA